MLIQDLIFGALLSNLNFFASLSSLAVIILPTGTRLQPYEQWTLNQKKNQQSEDCFDRKFNNSLSKRF